MKAHQLLLGLLISALVMANLVLSRIVHNSGSAWPDTYSVIGLGLVLAQTTLVAAWLVWGGPHAAVRTGTSLFVLYSLAHPASIYAIDPPAVWFTANLGLLAMIGMVFLIARFAGCTLRSPAADSQPAALAAWQFSLGSILSMMTGVAFVLGAARHLQFPAAAGVSTLLFFVLLTFLAAISFFIGFRLQRVWLAAALIGLLALSAAFFSSWVGVRGEQWWTVAQLNLSHVAGVAISVAILRIAGYRLDIPTRNCSQRV